MKKLISALLALTMLLAVFAGCTKIKDPDKYGAVLDMYLGTKPINLDPATAYTDESLVRVLNLLFEGLMRINEKGKLEKALAKKYEFYTDNKTGEKVLKIWLNTTYWSDSSLVQSHDVVYAWKRILDPAFSSEAAVMLYPIKGARQAKLGEIGIDDIGLYAVSKNILEVRFEKGADTNEFLYNLASPALVPLRENKISLYQDTWSRSSTDLSTNGPFRARKFTGDEGETLLLERSKYYYRNNNLSSEALDKSVTPYRIYVHFSDPLDLNIISSKDEEAVDVVTRYRNEEYFFVSGLTGSVAADFGKTKTTELASTYSFYFNTSNKALSNQTVRYALSIALDRNAIAEAVGGGVKAATGLVPSKIFDTKKGTSFRKNGGNILSSSASIDEAKAILDEAGINPATYDELYLYYLMDYTNDSYQSAQMGYMSKEKTIATYAKDTWEALGFSVVIKGVNATEYEQVYKSGDYDVLGLDVQALSAYSFAMLAPFAKSFSGKVRLVDSTSKDFDKSKGVERYYVNETHITGYYNEEYDALIEKAFAAATQKEKAALLHQAEELLIKDAPVVPVLFNSDCYVVSNKLSGFDTDFFGSKSFTKTALKNYLNYLHD